MLKAGIEAMQKWVTPGTLTDPDAVLYAVRVAVWGRWFVWLVGVFLLAYRPGFWYPEDIEFLSIPVLLGMVNGLVHHRLLTNRPVPWRRRIIPPRSIPLSTLLLRFSNWPQSHPDRGLGA